MESSGNHEELYRQTLSELEQVKPKAVLADELLTSIRSSNEKRVEAIPENFRSAIPTDYPPHKLASWLDANESVFKRPAPPPTDAGAGGAGGSRSISLTDEERAIAKRFGMSAEDYIKHKARLAGDGE